MRKVGEGAALRAEMRAANAKYEARPRITVTGCHIDLVHHARSIEAASLVSFRNDTGAPLDSYCFSLNPGFSIRSIRRNAETLPFTRDLHVFLVRPECPLPPGGIDSLLIRYDGAIQNEACYSDIDERERAQKNAFYGMVFDQRYGFIAPRYVLLTPETLWYPVPGIPMSNSPRVAQKDFIHFSLTVTANPALTAISQGRKTDGGGGKQHSIRRRSSPGYPW